MPRQIASIAASALLLATLAILPGGPGHSASLDKDTCNRLKTEQDGLEKAGIRATMAKGPDWAKANLPPEKLAEIRRAIELDEQLLFRCAGKPLVVLPPEADPAATPPPDDKGKPAEGDKKEDKKNAATPSAPAPAPPAEIKAPVQKKPAPQRKAAVQKDGVKSDADVGKGSVEEPPPKGPAKAKPKPKAKPKDDAYKAPQFDLLNPLGLN